MISNTDLGGRLRSPPLSLGSGLPTALEFNLAHTSRGGCASGQPR